MKSTFRFAFAAIAGAALLYGCASSPKAKDEAVPASSPLAAMAARQMLVFPAQYLSVPNPGGGWDIVPGARALLPILDEELADVFHKRGIKGNWTFGRAITESAARNGGITADPRELSVQGIRRIKAGDTPLPEPLAGEIRGIVALTSARFAILPLEVHVDARGTERRGSLHILVIDTRTARVSWVDDIEATPVRDEQATSEGLSPYAFRMLARDLASKFADMVVTQ